MEDREKDYNHLNISDNLGLDIANKLRSHFLANLPAQSYAWLNGMTSSSSSNLPSSSGYPAWLNNIRSEQNSLSHKLNPLVSDRSSRAGASLLDTNKMTDKHPMGGIR